MNPAPVLSLTPVQWVLLCLFILAAQGLVPIAHGAADADYESLSGSKALAVVPGGNGEGAGLAHGQANDLLAAATALDLCEARRRPEQSHCEIRRLNSESVTSGAEIRAAAPIEPHPLNLWEINSGSATVYLAGSVHILKPSLYPLPVPFEQAFSASDHLVVEVNLGAYEPAALQQLTLSHAVLPDGQRIDQVLPGALFDRLSASYRRYGVDPNLVASFKPAFHMNQIVLMRLRALGYQAEYGVEQHYLKRSDDRDILELETLDQQLGLLFNQPMPVQIQLLADSVNQEAEIEPLIAGMLSAWLAGNDARFMALFERQAGDSPAARRFTEQLLDERNRTMVSRIRAFLDGEGSYFVLVGAAHLIGPEGIVALLADAGIRSRRFQSDGTLLSGHSVFLRQLAQD